MNSYWHKEPKKDVTKYCLISMLDGDILGVVVEQAGKITTRGEEYKSLKEAKKACEDAARKATQ
jgi:hypothetical protein